MVKDTSFANSRGQSLPARIYIPQDPSGAGVIFSHGLFSSRDGYKITGLAADITATGHSLLTFDFSCTPESGGSFSDLSVKQEIDDLFCAVNFFKDQGIADIHLMGSSMGGAVSLLCAAEKTFNPLSLMLIATPVRVGDVLSYSIAGDLSALPSDGYTSIDGIRVRNAFFHEVNSLDIESLLPGIKVPCLVIHGSDDRVVPVMNAKTIAEKTGAEIRLVEIQGGDHNLTDDRAMGILRSEISSWLGGGWRT